MTTEQKPSTNSLQIARIGEKSASQLKKKKIGVADSGILFDSEKFVLLPDDSHFKLKKGITRSVLEISLIARKEKRAPTEEDLTEALPDKRITKYEMKDKIRQAISYLNQQLKDQKMDYRINKQNELKTLKEIEEEEKKAQLESAKIPNNQSLKPNNNDQDKKVRAEENDEVKNLRIKVAETILSAITRDNLDSLEKSPDKFLIEVITGNERNNSRLALMEVDNLRRFILKSVRETIIEVTQKDPETLSSSEKQILSDLRFIVKEWMRTTSREYIFQRMIDSVREHFSSESTYY